MKKAFIANVGLAVCGGCLLALPGCRMWYLFVAEMRAHRITGVRDPSGIYIYAIMMLTLILSICVNDAQFRNHHRAGLRKMLAIGLASVVTLLASVVACIVLSRGFMLVYRP